MLDSSRERQPVGFNNAFGILGTRWIGAGINVAQRPVARAGERN
ncbi:hypothetical protein BH24CHL10_BH24CHL10_04570 [soil metagenome]